jgi:hypothetical protein
MSKRPKRSKKKDFEFFLSLAVGDSVSLACQRAQYARRTVYEWRKEDAEFAARWDSAVEEGTDSLIDEARRRATKGTLRPVYYKGKPVGGIREFSDSLLMFLIKAKRTEYRDRFPQPPSEDGLNEQLQLLAAALNAGPVEGEEIEGQTIEGKFLEAGEKTDEPKP